MTIYILSILLLLSLSYLELNVAMSPATKKALELFVYVFLVLQVGLRWETGTDWDIYLQYFESISSFTSASPTIWNPEYGYNISVWLVKLVFSSYSAFLLIHAAVYYYLVFESIKRYTSMLYLPLMVFYSFTTAVEGSNRQLIAVAVGMYALRYIREEKKTYFFLLVALACMFHTSAILLLLLLLSNKKIRLRTLLLLLACSIAVGTSRLPALMFSIIGNSMGAFGSIRAAYYLGGDHNSIIDSGLSISGLVKRLIFLSLFFLNRRAMSEKLPYYNVMLNAYILGVVVYFLFANSLTIIVSRGDLYFNVLEPLLLASQVYLLVRRSSKVVMATALCVLSFFLFYASIFPFTEAFFPYKSIFNR